MMTPGEIAQLPYRPCVGLCITHSSGAVWVGERVGYAGAWQMPQGGIDPGETPTEAALRELHEETSLRHSDVTILAESENWHPYDLPHESVPHLWKGRYRGQTQKWFHMRLIGSEAAISIETDEPEFARWRWMPAKDVLDQIVSFKRDGYHAVLTEFDLLK